MATESSSSGSASPPATGDAYPPPRHLLWDLPLSVGRLPTGEAAGRLLVTEGLSVQGLHGRELAAGPLLTALDVLAGLAAAGEVSPDWIATAALSWHRLAPVPVGADLDLRAEVVRAGSSTVVLELDVDLGGTTVSEALATFVRLPRREGVNPTLDPLEGGLRPVMGSAAGGGLLDGASWDEAIGAAPHGVPDDDPERAAGATGTSEWVTPLVAELRNSFGAMNGGVVASLAVAAARVAAGAGHGDPVGAGATVDDVEVHYVGLGRIGPVVARPTVMRRRGGSVLVGVEVHDTGAERLMALVHVTCSQG